jgi:hypothetical protein
MHSCSTVFNQSDDLKDMTTSYRPRSRQDNIKVNLEHEGEKIIQLTHDKVQRRPLVNTILNLRVAHKTS